MAYSIVASEVLASGTRVFWFSGTDASKPTSGLTIGSIYTTTDNGKFYKATSATTWVELTAASGTGLGPEGTKYHPDRTPSSLNAAASDEFTGGITTSYTSALGTGTLNAELDTARFRTLANGGIDRKAFMYPAPSGVDFCCTMKLSLGGFGFFPVNPLVGIMLIETGTVATPTSLCMVATQRNATTTTQFGFWSSTSYTAAYTGIGSGSALSQQWIVGPAVWLQLLYTAGTKTVTVYASLDGRNFAQIGNSRVLAAHPLFVGGFMDQNGANATIDVIIHYFRTRTDATGTTSPRPVGA